MTTAEAAVAGEKFVKLGEKRRGCWRWAAQKKYEAEDLLAALAALHRQAVQTCKAESSIKSIGHRTCRFPSWRFRADSHPATMRATSTSARQRLH